MIKLTSLKKTGFALSIALAVTAGSASAAVYSLADTHGTPTPAGVYAATSNNPFTDYFRFTLSNAASSLSTASESIKVTLTYPGGFAVTLPAVEFTRLAIDTDTTPGNELWASPTADGTASLSFTAGPLSAGNYYLVVSGTADAPGGLYAAGVSAVPEPGDWAMMLAGLGMVGVIVRQRSRKN